MTEQLRALSIRIGERAGEISALLLQPPNATALLVLAHGAGAGMQHPFMREIAALLAERRIATLRYQFPYMQRRQRRPDPPAVLTATVRAAVAEAHAAAGDLPVFAAGKSMGGRMNSQAAAQKPGLDVRGLIFFGFPLHPAGQPGRARAEHLASVHLPMLFLQGTRDGLADLELLRSALADHAPDAQLHVVDGADHSFHMLKRSGRSDADVMAELAATVEAFVGGR